MVVTDAGIRMRLRLLHPLKQSLYIVITWGGITKLSNAEQFENAPAPILITLLGSTSSVKLVQSAKALS